MYYDARSNNIEFSRILLKAIALFTAIAFFVTSLPTDFAWAARTPSGVTRVASDRAGGPGSFKELNVETFNLPRDLGTVRDSWMPSLGHMTHDTSHKVVIHIQDAHCNYGAQHAIKDLVEYLNKEYGINTVNLEGGKDDYDLSLFTDIEKKEIREKVADYFVKEGIVNGAEYFAINNPEKIILWGVEDAEFYIKNLRAYRESLKYKEKIESHLKNLSYLLNSLKLQIYSKELLRLDRRYNQYKAGNLDLSDYLTYLVNSAQEKSISLESLPNISLLEKVLIREKKIDFKKANKEREGLIDEFQRILSKNSVEKFALKTVEFKEEKISEKEFYGHLQDTAKSINVKLEKYPNLENYIEYLSTYSSIDKSKIHEELEGLEDKLKNSLYRNEKERNLNVLSKNLALTNNMFNVCLTKDDYDYYRENSNFFEMQNYTSFIKREAPLYKVKAELNDGIEELDQHREDIAKFYEYSFKRDEAFLKNIQFGCPSAPEPQRPRNTASHGPARTAQVAILVTGGFHTENLCKLFKENSISYISIMPSFKKMSDFESPYFALLAGKKKDPVETNIRAILGATLAISSPFTELGCIVNKTLDAREVDNERIILLLRIEWLRAFLNGKGLIIKHRDNYNVLGAISVEKKLITKDEWEEMPEHERQSFEVAHAAQFAPSRQLPAPAIELAAKPAALPGQARPIILPEQVRPILNHIRRRTFVKLAATVVGSYLLRKAKSVFAQGEDTADRKQKDPGSLKIEYPHPSKNPVDINKGTIREVLSILSDYMQAYETIPLDYDVNHLMYAGAIQRRFYERLIKRIGSELDKMHVSKKAFDRQYNPQDWDALIRYALPKFLSKYNIGLVTVKRILRYESYEITYDVLGLFAVKHITRKRAKFWGYMADEDIIYLSQTPILSQMGLRSRQFSSIAKGWAAYHSHGNVLILGKKEEELFELLADSSRKRLKQHQWFTEDFGWEDYIKSRKRPLTLDAGLMLSAVKLYQEMSRTRTMKKRGPPILEGIIKHELMHGADWKNNTKFRGFDFKAPNDKAYQTAVLELRAQLTALRYAKDVKPHLLTALEWWLSPWMATQIGVTHEGVQEEEYPYKWAGYNITRHFISLIAQSPSDYGITIDPSQPKAAYVAGQLYRLKPYHIRYLAQETFIFFHKKYTDQPLPKFKRYTLTEFRQMELEKTQPPATEPTTPDSLPSLTTYFWTHFGMLGKILAVLTFPYLVWHEGWHLTGAGFKGRVDLAKGKYNRGAPFRTRIGGFLVALAPYIVGTLLPSFVITVALIGALPLTIPMIIATAISSYILINTISEIILNIAIKDPEADLRQAIAALRGKPVSVLKSTPPPAEPEGEGGKPTAGIVDRIKQNPLLVPFFLIGSILGISSLAGAAPVTSVAATLVTAVEATTQAAAALNTFYFHAIMATVLMILGVVVYFFIVPEKQKSNTLRYSLIIGGVCSTLALFMLNTTLGLLAVGIYSGLLVVGTIYTGRKKDAELAEPDHSDESRDLKFWYDGNGNLVVDLVSTAVSTEVSQERDVIVFGNENVSYRFGMRDEKFFVDVWRKENAFWAPMSNKNVKVEIQIFASKLLRELSDLKGKSDDDTLQEKVRAEYKARLMELLTKLHNLGIVLRPAHDILKSKGEVGIHITKQFEDEIKERYAKYHQMCLSGAVHLLNGIWDGLGGPDRIASSDTDKQTLRSFNQLVPVCLNYIMPYLGEARKGIQVSTAMSAFVTGYVSYRAKSLPEGYKPTYEEIKGWLLDSGKVEEYLTDRTAEPEPGEPPSQAAGPTLFTDTTDYKDIRMNDVVELKSEDGSSVRYRILDDFDKDHPAVRKAAIDAPDTPDHNKIIWLKFQKNAVESQREKNALQRLNANPLKEFSDNFVKGRSLVDSKGNIVNIVEHIEGQTIRDFVRNLRVSPDAYFRDYLPMLLDKLLVVAKALNEYHKPEHVGDEHGEICEYHIILEEATGEPKVFDYNLYTLDDNVGLFYTLIFLLSKGNAFGKQMPGMFWEMVGDYQDTGRLPEFAESMPTFISAVETALSYWRSVDKPGETPSHEPAEEGSFPTLSERYWKELPYGIPILRRIPVLPKVLGIILSTITSFRHEIMHAIGDLLSSGSLTGRIHPLKGKYESKDGEDFKHPIFVAKTPYYSLPVEALAYLGSIVYLFRNAHPLALIGALLAVTFLITIFGIDNYVNKHIDLPGSDWNRAEAYKKQLQEVREGKKGKATGFSVVRTETSPAVGREEFEFSEKRLEDLWPELEEALADPILMAGDEELRGTAVDYAQKRAKRALKRIMTGHSDPIAFSREWSAWSQHALLVEDFRRTIKRKLQEKKDSYELTIYQIGIGREIGETEKLILAAEEALKSVIKDEGERKKWSLLILSIDATPGCIELAQPKYDAISAGSHFPEPLSFGRVTAKAVRGNTLDLEDLRKIYESTGKTFESKEKIKRPDYIINRHTHYGNHLAKDGVLALDVAQTGEDAMLAHILSVYISIRNIFKAFGSKGVKYVVEPAQVIDGEDNEETPVLVIPGARLIGAKKYLERLKGATDSSLINRGSGIYEIEDPKEIAKTGLKQFLEGIEKPAEPQLIAKAAPSGQDLFYDGKVEDVDKLEAELGKLYVLMDKADQYPQLMQRLDIEEPILEFLRGQHNRNEGGDLIEDKQFIAPDILGSTEVFVIKDELLDQHRFKSLKGPGYGYANRIFIRESEYKENGLKLIVNNRLTYFARILIHELVARHLGRRAPRTKVALGKGTLQHWAARNLEQQLEMEVLFDLRAKLEKDGARPQQLKKLEVDIKKLKTAHSDELEKIEADIKAKTEEAKKTGKKQPEQDLTMGGAGKTRSQAAQTADSPKKAFLRNPSIETFAALPESAREELQERAKKELPGFKKPGRWGGHGAYKRRSSWQNPPYQISTFVTNIIEVAEETRAVFSEEVGSEDAVYIALGSSPVWVYRGLELAYGNEFAGKVKYIALSGGLRAPTEAQKKAYFGYLDKMLADEINSNKKIVISDFFMSVSNFSMFLGVFAEWAEKRGVDKKRLVCHLFTEEYLDHLREKSIAGLSKLNGIKVVCQEMPRHAPSFFRVCLDSEGYFDNRWAPHFPPEEWNEDGPPAYEVSAKAVLTFFLLALEVEKNRNLSLPTPVTEEQKLSVFIDIESLMDGYVKGFEESLAVAKKARERVSSRERALSLAKRHITMLKQEMVRLKASNFIAALKKMTWRKTSSTQKKALDILAEKLKSDPDIEFDPGKVVFLPEDSWLRGFLGFSDGDRGLCVPVIDSSGEEDHLILVDGAIQDPLTAAKCICHEIMHPKFTSGRVRVNPEEKGIFGILVEAMVERKAFALMQKVIVNTYLQRAYSFLGLSFSQSGGIDRKLASSGGYDLKGIVPLLQTYEEERKFLEKLIAFKATRIGKKPDEIESAIIEYLKGDATGLREIFDQHTWNLIAGIAHKVRHFPKQNAGYKACINMLSASLDYGQTEEGKEEEVLEFALSLLNLCGQLHFRADMEEFDLGEGEPDPSGFKECKYKAADELFGEMLRGEKPDLSGKSDKTREGLLQRTIRIMNKEKGIPAAEYTPDGKAARSYNREDFVWGDYYIGPEDDTPSQAAGIHGILTTNEEAGEYIYKHLPGGLIFKSRDPNDEIARAERGRRLKELLEKDRGHKYVYQKKDPETGEIITFIKIEGLLNETGQFAHIGLERTYGRTVVYIDKGITEREYPKVQNAKRIVENHELAEIRRWRKALTDPEKFGGREEVKTFSDIRDWARKNVDNMEKFIEWTEEIHEAANREGGDLVSTQSNIDELAEKLGITPYQHGLPDELTRMAEGFQERRKSNLQSEYIMGDRLVVNAHVDEDNEDIIIIRISDRTYHSPVQKIHFSIKKREFVKNFFNIIAIERLYPGFLEKLKSLKETVEPAVAEAIQGLLQGYTYIEASYNLAKSSSSFSDSYPEDHEGLLVGLNKGLNIASALSRDEWQEAAACHIIKNIDPRISKVLKMSDFEGATVTVEPEGTKHPYFTIAFRKDIWEGGLADRLMSAKDMTRDMRGEPLRLHMLRPERAINGGVYTDLSGYGIALIPKEELSLDSTAHEKLHKGFETLISGLELEPFNAEVLAEIYTAFDPEKNWVAWPHTEADILQLLVMGNADDEIFALFGEKFTAFEELLKTINESKSINLTAETMRKIVAIGTFATGSLDSVIALLQAIKASKEPGRILKEIIDFYSKTIDGDVKIEKRRRDAFDFAKRIARRGLAEELIQSGETPSQAAGAEGETRDKENDFALSFQSLMAEIKTEFPNCADDAQVLEDYISGLSEREARFVLTWGPLGQRIQKLSETIQKFITRRRKGSLFLDPFMRRFMANLAKHIKHAGEIFNKAVRIPGTDIPVFCRYTPKSIIPTKESLYGIETLDVPEETVHLLGMAVRLVKEISPDLFEQIKKTTKAVVVNRDLIDEGSTGRVKKSEVGIIEISPRAREQMSLVPLDIVDYAVTLVHESVHTSQYLLEYHKELIVDLEDQTIPIGQQADFIDPPHAASPYFYDLEAYIAATEFLCDVFLKYSPRRHLQPQKLLSDINEYLEIARKLLMGLESIIGTGKLTRLGEEKVGELEKRYDALRMQVEELLPDGNEPESPSQAAGIQGILTTNEEAGRHIKEKIRVLYPELYFIGDTTEARRTALETLAKSSDERVYALSDPRTGEEIVFIKIPGLLDEKGQFAHIGLEQTYGRTVVYIDEDTCNTPSYKDIVEGHELTEIRLWKNALEHELKGKIANLSEARAWMKQNIGRALLLTDRFHRMANRVANRKFDIDRLARSMGKAPYSYGLEEISKFTDVVEALRQSGETPSQAAAALDINKAIIEAVASNGFAILHDISLQKIGKIKTLEIAGHTVEIHIDNSIDGVYEISEDGKVVKINGATIKGYFGGYADTFRTMMVSALGEAVAVQAQSGTGKTDKVAIRDIKRNAGIEAARAFTMARPTLQGGILWIYYNENIFPYGIGWETYWNEIAKRAIGLEERCDFDTLNTEYEKELEKEKDTEKGTQEIYRKEAYELAKELKKPKLALRASEKIYDVSGFIMFEEGHVVVLRDAKTQATREYQLTTNVENGKAKAIEMHTGRPVWVAFNMEGAQLDRERVIFKRLCENTIPNFPNVELCKDREGREVAIVEDVKGPTLFGLMESDELQAIDNEEYIERYVPALLQRLLEVSVALKEFQKNNRDCGDSPATCGHGDINDENIIIERGLGDVESQTVGRPVMVDLGQKGSPEKDIEKLGEILLLILFRRHYWAGDFPDKTIPEKAFYKSRKDEYIIDGRLLAGFIYRSKDRFDESLYRILDRCLGAAEPYASMADFIFDLESALKGLQHPEPKKDYSMLQEAEVREKAVRDAFASAGNPGDVVKVVIGVPIGTAIGDMEKGKYGPLARDISKILAAANIGLVRKHTSQSPDMFDEDQIEIFFIDDRDAEGGYSEATMSGLKSAVDRARKNMGDKKGRIVVFVPQTEKIQLAKEVESEYVPREVAETEEAIKVTVVRDAYTDSRPQEEEKKYLDIVARVALARLINTCLSATGDRTEALEGLDAFLRQLDSTYATTTQPEDQDANPIGYLLKNALKIKPLIYDDMRAYQISQKAVASSA